MKKKNSDEEEKDILDTPKKKDNDESDLINLSDMTNKNLVEYSKIKIEKLSFFSTICLFNNVYNFLYSINLFI